MTLAAPDTYRLPVIGGSGFWAPAKQRSSTAFSTADTIILNKAENAAGPTQTNAACKTIRSLNADAKIIKTRHSDTLFSSPKFEPYL